MYDAYSDADKSPKPMPTRSPPSACHAFVTNATPVTAPIAASHTVGVTLSLRTAATQASTSTGARNWIVIPGPTPKRSIDS